jgi:lincosamide nucleotidyltransferase A/C/D/E
VQKQVMTAASVIRLLDALSEEGVDPVVGGGWAVDALLEEQTREHSDLDLWLPAEGAESVFRGLGGCGIDRLLPWPGDRPWNFVLTDGAVLRVDLHFYERTANELLHYGSAVSGVTFPPVALAGRGRVAGTVVRCEAPEWVIRWHADYPPRPVDHHDVAAVCQRFGLELPEAYR